MKTRLNCPCGELIRGEDEDDLVERAFAHLREKHPDMADEYEREHIPLHGVLIRVRCGRLLGAHRATCALTRLPEHAAHTGPTGCGRAHESPPHTPHKPAPARPGVELLVEHVARVGVVGFDHQQARRSPCAAAPPRSSPRTGTRRPADGRRRRGARRRPPAARAARTSVTSCTPRPPGRSTAPAWWDGASRACRTGTNTTHPLPIGPVEPPAGCRKYQELSVSAVVVMAVGMALAFAFTNGVARCSQRDRDARRNAHGPPWPRHCARRTGQCDRTAHPRQGSR